MNSFWKAIAMVIITVLLSIVIGHQEKSFVLLITMAACTMVMTVLTGFLEPVIELVFEMEDAAQLEDGAVAILLKATGIALVSELGSLFCKDAGNSALERLVQILGGTAILYLSIPFLRKLLMIFQEILGGI